MTSSSKQRRQQLQSLFEPGFKQMLLISLLLHLIIPVLYYTPLFPKPVLEKPPIYRVNLVNKPVKKPQAGRPEAAQAAKQVPAKPKAKPIPPKPKPVASTKPAPKPKSAVKPKPEPQPKLKPAIPKATAKPQPPAAPSRVQEDALQQRLKELAAKRDQQAAEAARKQKIEALKAAALAESSQLKSPISEAPVGMVGGTGSEAGVSAIAFVQEFIQQQWSFSRYQANGSPEAEVTLFYNAAGELLHYRFTRKSGNSAFDESLTRALTKSRQLPQPLPEAMSFEIIFNLKDMLTR